MEETGVRLEDDFDEGVSGPGLALDKTFKVPSNLGMASEDVNEEDMFATEVGGGEEMAEGAEVVVGLDEEADLLLE